MKLVSKAEYDEKIKQLRANYKTITDGREFAVARLVRTWYCPWLRRWKIVTHSVPFYSGYDTGFFGAEWWMTSEKAALEVIEKAIQLDLHHLDWYMLADEQSCA